MVSESEVKIHTNHSDFVRKVTLFILHLQYYLP